MNAADVALRVSRRHHTWPDPEMANCPPQAPNGAFRPHNLKAVESNLIGHGRTRNQALQDRFADNTRYHSDSIDDWTPQ
jgi:hypothetical protein